jgi:predicted Zn-dependent peptidase
MRRITEVSFITGPVSNRADRIKKALLIFALACLAGSFAFSSQDKETEKGFTLENGLKVFLYERHNLPLVNIVVAVNAGSKDETDETNGLVHLLEHYILFRGTETRSGSDIAGDIRRHGAYFNAHTGQDLAIFEISIPAESADFGLANQKEILFNLKIDDKELESEKEVILEELSQIRDDPFRYASALCYQALFAGHPYGRPVFGKAEAIKALTSEQVNRFYKAYFIPGNCALAVVGDFNVKNMEDKVRAAFGTLPKTEFTPAKFSPPPPLRKSVEIEETLDVQEAYLVIGTAGPDFNNTDQYASDILTEILGRGISPLLYRPLKGQRDLINTAGMSYITFAHGGAFEVYLTLEPKRLAAAKAQALQFLRQVRNENFSRDEVIGEEKMYAYDFLGSAKNQISFGTQKAQENGLTLATSLAMYLLLQGSDIAPRNYLDNIRKVTSSDLRKTAAKYLSRGEYVLVSIVPKKK